MANEPTPDDASPAPSPCVDGGWRAVLAQEEAALDAEDSTRLVDASFSVRVRSLAWSTLQRDPDRAAAMVLEALRRDPSPSNQQALAMLFSDFEEYGGLGRECELAAEATLERLAESCNTSQYMGLVVRTPLSRDRGEACAMVACARCQHGLALVRRSFDDRLHFDSAPAVYAEASAAYESLAFGPNAVCPASLHAAQMAVNYAAQADNAAQHDALAARLDARFPVHVTYMVNRDIVSRGGPPDPCPSVGLGSHGTMSR